MHRLFPAINVNSKIIAREHKQKMNNYAFIDSCSHFDNVCRRPARVGARVPIPERDPICALQACSEGSLVAKSCP